MAITFVASATKTYGSTQSSITIDKPTGTAEDDVLIATLHMASTGVTAPSGWTLILENDDTGNGVDIRSYYKAAGASEPADYTWTLDTNKDVAGVVMTLRGVNTASPIDAQSGAADQTGTGTTATASSITTTADGAWYFFVATGKDSSLSWTPEFWMTERFDDGTGTRIGFVASYETPTAGATGDVSGYLSTSAPWICHMFAVAPAESRAVSVSDSVSASDSVSVSSPGAIETRISAPPGETLYGPVTIDVINRQGILQGAGPIYTASEIQYTRRLNRAGSFSFRMPKRDERHELLSPKASIVKIRMDGRRLTWGLVEQTRVTVDNADNIMLEVSGRDMLAELAEIPVAFLNISQGGGGVNDAPARILQVVNQFTPSQWVLDPFRSDLTTATDVYTKFAGESALQALIKIAEHIGEKFRHGEFLRSITWLNDAPLISLRAFQTAGDPIAVETNDDICLIRSLEEVTDSHELINRVYPHGSGVGETRLTLNPTTRTAPTGWTLNKAENYLENTASVNNLGATISRFVQFKSLRPISNTDQDLESASNALFDAAEAWLRKRDDTSDNKTYSLEVFKLSRDLRPGDRIQVVWKDDAYNVSGVFTVLEIATRIAANGGMTHRLTISATDNYPVSDGEIQAQQIEEGTVLSAHPQTNANSYRENHRVFVGEDQTSEKAEIRWWFGPEVVQLDQVLWRFNLTELVAPATTVGGTVDSTDSSSITTTSGGSSHSHETNNHQHVLTVPYGSSSVSRHVVLASSGNGFFYEHSSDEGDRTINTDNSGGGSTTTSDSSHTHGMDHTHDIDVGAALATEFGINRESAADTFVIGDLEYRVNNGAWSSLDAADSLAGGWYALDITDVLTSSNFRPAQEGNILEVRRKASGATGKTAMIDGALEIRNFIQSIAFR